MGTSNDQPQGDILLGDFLQAFIPKLRAFQDLAERADLLEILVQEQDVDIKELKARVVRLENIARPSKRRKRRLPGSGLVGRMSRWYSEWRRGTTEPTTSQ